MSDEEQAASEPQTRSVAAILEYRRQQLVKAGRPVPVPLLERLATAYAEEAAAAPES